jgi:lambda family phage portal protein
VNALDRAVSWLSPSAGLRRARARAALNVIERFAYDGARTTRRTEGWTAGNTSANAEIGSSLTKLRERSRQLLRDTPHAPKAVRVVCANVVGTGITPRTATGNPNRDKEVSNLWNRWAEEADADDQINLYGIQKLVIRTVFESGEAIVRYRTRRPQDGMTTIPLQLQVLEPDYLDLSRSQDLGNGNYIMQGIEFDALGTRVAYWLFGQHPGDTMSFRGGSLASKRIPASEILHVYDKQRPGQVRGVPWLAPVLLKMRDLDDYDEAELVRKKIESCFAAFVTQPEGEDGPTLGTASTQSGTDNRIEQFEPGMIEYLKPGEQIQFGNPKGEGGYSEYSKTQLRAIAAGLGITYEQLTGDLSNTNYSSYRAGQLDFRAWIEDFRWNAFMPMFNYPVWRRFVSTAIISGALSPGEYPAKWTAPPFQSVQPLEDAKANEQKMRNGMATLREVIVGEGFDPDEQLEEIAATNKQLDELGIVLDCDPRNTARTAQGRPPGS